MSNNDVHDPQTWEALPADLRTDMTLTKQRELVNAVLRNSQNPNFGEFFMSKRRRGETLRWSMLVIANRDETFIPEETRIEMEKRKAMWWINVIDPRNPGVKGGNDDFASMCLKASKTSPMGDFWILLCDQGVSYLIGWDIDAWIQWQRDVGIDEPVVANAANDDAGKFKEMLEKVEST